MEDYTGVIIISATIALVAIGLFFMFGFEPMTRSIIISNGNHARAKILGKKLGNWTMGSDGHDGRNVTAQQVILKLEVHPDDALTYVCEDKFMAKAKDLVMLNEGCDIQVVISKSNPMRVVCLPETVTASLDAPVQARAGMAMADLIDQAAHGQVPTTEQVLASLQAQGVKTTSFVDNSSQPGDPKTALTTLKAMLDAGLINQQEFDTKKKDILGRM